MIRKEPTAISLPNANRKPPEIYEGEYGPELIYYQLDEALRLQNNTFNAKAAMLNEAVLDVGIAIVQGVQNKFVRTLPGQKPIYYHPMEPKPDDLLYSVRPPAGDLIPFYQVGNPYPRWRKNGEPVPAYESMMLNAGYDAELRVDND